MFILQSFVLITSSQIQMEINDQSLGQLKGLLATTLSANNVERKGAEAYIKTVETQPGFPLLLLTLITRLINSTDKADVNLRQVASVLFKNLVKNRWQPEDEDELKNVVAATDKETIKTHLVELMCTAPQDVQRQLAEAVTLISKHDFPAKWTNLLPQLTAKLASQDILITKGVMLTANSIMKRFRYVYKSDQLFSEIIICLDGFKTPLLERYQAYDSLITQYSQSIPELVALLETQRLMTRVFFSLNWQDIPEFFEDNVALWMTEFAKYLSYKNPLLLDNDEANESGPVEKLQAAVLENLNLYATKYEDVFEPFLPQFTQLVWKLLMEVGPQPKFDILATNAIKFLTSVSSKQMNVGLFTEPVLRDIVEHIVVRNLMATEADEELFEDNPTDFIRKDMEGSDQDTRRRAASELVRSLLKFFGPQVTQLCTSYIGAMLEQYRVSKDWRAKDAALHLVLAVSVKSSSTTAGAGELNPGIDIMSVFQSHILPEVQEAGSEDRPIVLSDAIKMICIFRSHLPTPFLLALLPHIIRHLKSKHVVIQTYAALCIERFLTVKDRDPVSGEVKQRVTKESLSAHFQALFEGLFRVLENPDLPENDYVMKCIMRMLVVVGADIGSVTELVLLHLTKALERVCKNPVNPHYNHYLFESLAVLVRSCCGTGATYNEVACSRFEALLFPPFQSVLALDVAEFVPYVFQILAQLLSSRPVNSGLSEAYRALFPPLMAPVLWERKGNVPALTELYIAYVSRGMAEIVSGGNLTGVLGVFQKLLASKTNETYAFSLLDNLIIYNSTATLTPFLPTIFQLLLHRMQESMKDTKTPRYCKLFIHSICLFSTVHGAKLLYDSLETLTPGLVGMIITNVWSVNRAACAACDRLEVKQMIIGGCKLLTDSPVAQKPEVWGSLFKSILSLVDAGADKGAQFGGNDDEDLDEGKDFDSTYSKLAYASVVTADPSESVTQAPATYFATTVSAFTRAYPGQYVGAIQSVLDAREAAALQALLQQSGVSIA